MIPIAYRHAPKTQMLFIDNLVRFLRSYPYKAIGVLNGLLSYVNEVRPEIGDISSSCLFHSP
jgi:hypothetical protein